MSKLRKRGRKGSQQQLQHMFTGLMLVGKQQSQEINIRTPWASKQQLVSTFRFPNAPISPVIRPTRALPEGLSSIFEMEASPPCLWYSSCPPFCQMRNQPSHVPGPEDAAIRTLKLVHSVQLPIGTLSFVRVAGCLIRFPPFQNQLKLFSCNFLYSFHIWGSAFGPHNNPVRWGRLREKATGPRS